MGNPGLDPNMALDLLQALLNCIVYILGALVSLGLCAYGVFLWSEIFSPRRCLKPRLGEVLHPVGWTPPAEENFDRFAAEIPILAGVESLGVESE